MPSGVCVWFLTLLAVTFVSRNDAIKCYQCNNCPDKAKLTEARECTNTTLSETYKKFFSSSDENRIVETKDSEDMKKGTLKAEPIAILTCHKVVKKNGSAELVIRGCSPYLTPKIRECASSGHEEMCLYVCEKDECNKATTYFMPATIFTSLLLTLTLFIL